MGLRGLMGWWMGVGYWEDLEEEEEEDGGGGGN